MRTAGPWLPTRASRALAGASALAAAWVALTGLVLVLNRLLPLPPLQVSDFVVTAGGDLILFSNFNRTVYRYDADGNLQRRFRIPEAGGSPKLAVDAADRLYLARRRSVTVWLPDGAPGPVISTGLDESEDWRLRSDGHVEHLSRGAAPVPPAFDTQRLRRVARPGDILFQQTGDGLHSLSDPFVDDAGNHYECRRWFDGIDRIAPDGRRTRVVGPGPFWRWFALPIPAVFGLLGGMILLALLEWIRRRL